MNKWLVKASSLVVLGGMVLSAGSRVLADTYVRPIDNGRITTGFNGIVGWIMLFRLERLLGQWQMVL